MRKALCAAMAALVILAGACEAKKKDPAPKPVIAASEVKLCIDSAFKTREKDERCNDTSATGCCSWRYVRNQAPWPLGLPAVGEVLENGRGFDAPISPSPVTIPPQGAVFTR